MTLARIKMLELAQEDCHEMICNIRKANDEFSKSIGRLYPCPIALYLKGPDIRIGSLKDVDTFILKPKANFCQVKNFYFKKLISRCVLKVD